MRLAYADPPYLGLASKFFASLAAPPPSLDVDRLARR